MKKNLIIILIFLGISCLLALLYINSKARTATRVFSDYSLLTSTWEKYKATFISSDGRVIDYSQNNITTSEGQSYALLRSVWSDDQPTFDQVWVWTKNNLQREDYLFAWKWGQREDQSYGVLTNGGENSATDSDTDIALALIFAASRWNNSQYLNEAQLILSKLWELNVVEVQGKYYLLPGQWAKSNENIVLNPSYFAPYAWKIFAQVDSSHNWNELVTPAYELLTQAGNATLRNQNGVGLPPDWISININSGQLVEPPSELSVNYSYDAMRIPWRIALDYQWNQDPQAISYLNSLNKLNDIYQINHNLMSEYSHSGEPLTNYESPSFYGTALAYFKTIHSNVADEIYNQKILSLYSTDTNSFKSELGYYDQNWVWFGVAFYTNSLPNLYKKTTTT